MTAHSLMSVVLAVLLSILASLYPLPTSLLPGARSNQTCSSWTNFANS